MKEKKLTIPPKRIDSDGNERDMESPYEMGGYYCTIGLDIHENPYPQSDEFNHRRFLDGYRDRRGVAKLFVMRGLESLRKSATFTITLQHRRN